MFTNDDKSTLTFVCLLKDNICYILQSLIRPHYKDFSSGQESNAPF